MFSLTPEYISRIKLSTMEQAVLRELNQYRGDQQKFFQQPPEVLEKLRQLASEQPPGQKIEVAVLPRAKEKHGLVLQQRGYKEALAKVHASAHDLPFSLDTISQLHKILFSHMPLPGGQWREGDSLLLEDRRDGKRVVRTEGPKAPLIADMMQQLVARYQQLVADNTVEPLLLIPLVIFDFIRIHPFADGNGRVSRLLTILLLYHFDYQIARHMDFDRVFDESRAQYYDNLHASTPGWPEGEHDIKPWLNYFWSALSYAQVLCLIRHVDLGVD